MFKTFEQIITEVQNALSQVTGLGVQSYSQDKIGDMIQRTFNRVRVDRWWSHLMRWQQLALDGTTGHTTTAQLVLDYTDIRGVFRSDWDRKLSEIPSEVNPFRIMGITPRYIAADDTVPGQVFMVYPITATDSALAVAYRKGYPSFTLTDTVPFDSDTVVTGSAWQYSSDDGTNPAQTAKFKAMFDDFLMVKEQQHDSQPIILDPRVREIPDQWREY